MKFSEIELPSNKKFGYFFTIVFFILGIYFYSLNLLFFSYLFLTFFIMFIIITQIKSEYLLPLNKIWMSLGFLLGKIISPIILGIIYFGIFTSVSLVMKVFGRDELVLKVNNKNTQWRDRSNDELYVRSFKNQF